MDQAEKTKENRLRRKAARQGYRLQKSRARDPEDLTYGGYQIVDPSCNGLVCGIGITHRGFGADLDEIEEWLGGG